MVSRTISRDVLEHSMYGESPYHEHLHVRSICINIFEGKLTDTFIMSLIQHLFRVF